MKLIEAEDLLRKFDEVLFHDYGIKGIGELKYARIREIINSEPEVKARAIEPAHWKLKKDEGGIPHYFCTRCGAKATLTVTPDGKFIGQKLSRFCPECGSRMDATTTSESVKNQFGVKIGI